MEHLLHKEGDFQFLITNTFDGKMLIPIIKNLLHKAENEWDDYDEVYHCCHLIETVRKNQNMKMDFHILKKGEDNIGIGLVTHGIIDMPLFFSDTMRTLDAAENFLVFNYFHISHDDRGHGTHWLRDIILPYYQAKGFVAVYIKSSHAKVFSLYNRLGESIGEYESKSDNGLWTRPGKIFRVPLI